MTSNNKQKQGFAPIIVILAIVVVLGLGYLFTTQKNNLSSIAPTQTVANPTELPIAKNPDPIAGWKTHISSQYSVKYPNEWFLYDYKGTNLCVALSDIKNPTDIPVKVSPSGHSIVSICFYQGKMPDSFPYTNGSSNNQTIKQYSINGYSGIRGEQTSTIGLADNVYLDNSKGGYIQILNEIGNIITFDQILSTFKFINQAVDETSNWKTYENTKYGFSIKYPPTLPPSESSSNLAGEKDFTTVQFKEAQTAPGWDGKPTNQIMIRLYGKETSPAYLIKQKNDYESLLALPVGANKQVVGSIFTRLPNEAIFSNAYVFEERAVPNYPAEVIPYSKGYLLKKDNTIIYVLVWPLTESTTDKYMQFFNQMVQTFKFTQ